VTPRRRGIGGILIVSALALAGIGCSADGGNSTSPTPTTGQSDIGGGSTTNNQPTQADFAALEAKLVQDVPGFELQPDDVGDTGPSDLAKAQRDDGTKAGADLLVENGFRLGYQKLFVNDAGDQIIIFAYEFRTAAGATAHCKADARRTESQMGGNMTDDVAVPGVPTDFAKAGTEDGFTATIIQFATGPYCVRIIGNGEARPAFTTPAPEVAQQQYQRLR
jgi:hypothetical protein